jgi:hypothetical protein
MGLASPRGLLYIECVKIKELRIGQCVRHPSHDGLGDVTRIEPKQVEVFFNHGKMILDEQEIEKLTSTDSIDTSMMDVREIIRATVEATLHATETNATAPEMSKKFREGRLVMHPDDPSLSPKEVPLQTFFHKIVMVRDNLRVLEQKINSHAVLSEQEKVELQQYLTRVAGSLTTFNSLFQDKDGGF